MWASLIQLVEQGILPPDYQIHIQRGREREIHISLFYSAIVGSVSLENLDYSGEAVSHTLNWQKHFIR
jgi:hypothetical protein